MGGNVMTSIENSVLHQKREINEADDPNMTFYEDVQNRYIVVWLTRSFRISCAARERKYKILTAVIPH